MKMALLLSGLSVLNKAAMGNCSASFIDEPSQKQETVILVGDNNEIIAVETI